MTTGAWIFLAVVLAGVLLAAYCAWEEWHADRKADRVWQENLAHPAHPTPWHQLTRVEHELGTAPGSHTFPGEAGR